MLKKKRGYKIKKSNAIPVIFDTDMDMDCDDSGALAVLHALMDLGEANILGIICDVPSEASVKCVVAINRYYNRNIPVGLISGENFASAKRYQLYRYARKNVSVLRDYYTEEIARQFKTNNLSSQDYSDSVSLYRQLLSQSDDKSVVIIAVGLLTALSKILDSKPDKYSTLSGEELVKQKVLKLVTMGIGKFPSSMAEFNWLMDWDAARRIFNNWPTKIVVQFNGTQFLTGKTLSSKTPETNPVRKCYEIYLRGPKKGNFSWDPIAALYGVRGSDPYFEEVKGYKIVLERVLGKNYWIRDESEKSSYSFLRLKSPRKHLRNEIENLMVKPPNN